VPVGALAQGTSLRLYPDDGCRAARFEKYGEGWDLFREAAESDEEPDMVCDGGWGCAGGGARVHMDTTVVMRLL
jgi:hypothetical protein